MKVTIGIPFLNNRHTLIAAVQSVFAQTFSDWELILVNDGSRDSSLELVRLISDPRVSVISDGRQLALPSRLNAITRLARGEYVARMDADDIMYPDRIAEQVRFLDKRADLDLVATGITTIDISGMPYGQRSLEPIRINGRGFLSGRTFAHVTVMARREWMLRNPYDESFVRSQDYELWCRAVRCGDARFGKIERPLLFVSEVGATSLAKRILSSRYSARVAWRHGPAIAGWLATCQVLVRTFGAEVFHRLTCPFGLDRKLVQHRSQSLQSDEFEAATSQLRRVLATSVPGWNAVSDTPSKTTPPTLAGPHCEGLL